MGRNAGAVLAVTPYVLFMDADVVPGSYRLIGDALHEAKLHNRALVTTDIRCPDGRLRDWLAYSFNNLCQHASSLFRIPYATGMFMLWNRLDFQALGGFDEKAQFAEDYKLSKQLKPGKFGIVPGGVETSNRRLIKMGFVAWPGCSSRPSS